VVVVVVVVAPPRNFQMAMELVLYQRVRIHQMQAPGWPQIEKMKAPVLENQRRTSCLLELELEPKHQNQIQAQELWIQN